MTTYTHSEYINGNLFALDITLNTQEYNLVRDNAIDKLVSEVEINGFRKGHVPREKALSMLKLETISQNILEGIITKYNQEAVSELIKLLDKDGRNITNLDFDFDPKNTHEIAEGGFVFRILANLEPFIDLSSLDNFTIDEVSIKDVPDLPSKELFNKTEIAKIISDQNVFTTTDKPSASGYEVTVSMKGTIDGEVSDRLDSESMPVLIGSGMFLKVFEDNLIGLSVGDTKTFDMPFPDDYVPELKGKTAIVTIEVKEIKEPKYTTIEELLEGSDTLRNVYPTINEFNADLDNVYDSRVATLIDAVRRKKLVLRLLETIPEFEYDKHAAHNEAHRIIEELNKEAAAKSQTPNEILDEAGLSLLDPEQIAKLDKDGIHDEIVKYVEREIKLSLVLKAVFTKHVEPKPTEEELNGIFKQAKENKQQYGLADNATDDYIEQMMTDRIVRDRAGRWLLDKAAANAKA
jgi:trigger factor